MTEQDLTTLLHDHVRDGEPPLGLTAGAAILEGRRTLRRARLRRAAAGTAIIGATAAAVLPMMLSGGDAADTTRGIDPATQQALAGYDASAMPERLREVGDPLRDLLIAGTYRAMPGAFTAYDDQGTALPERYWDKASGMDLTYGKGEARQLKVSLLHSRAEAEGDARKNCQNDVETGYAFSCDVTVENGDLVTVRVFAVRALDEELESPGWGAVTREELRTGKPAVGDPIQRPIDPDEIFFIRSAESVHSETFLTTVNETVKAPTFAAALDRFSIPVYALTDVATDPSLVIPKPPQGPNGCAWQLHPENIRCSG